MALADNLLAYWSLEEGSGTRVDSHGSYNLTASGSPGSESGVVSNAAYLNATTKILTSSDNVFYPGSSDFSFSGWFRCHTALTSAAAAWLAGKYQSGSYNFRCWGLQIQHSVGLDSFWRAFVSTNGSSATNISTGVAISSGTRSTTAWHHWVLTRSGTTFTLYIDGAVEDTKTISGSLYDNTGDGVAFQLNGMGLDSNQSNTISADECGFWSRALSASEVTELYNSGAGRNYDYINPSGPTESRANNLLVGCWI